MWWNACFTLMKQLTFFWLTPVVGLFHECFVWVLPWFDYHFNSFLLTFITEVCCNISLFSRVLQKPFTWILSKFNWLVPTSCRIWVWGILEQITNSFISFLFLFTCAFFYIAPSRVFLKYVSCKLFRLYLLIFIGLLTSIQGIL